MAVDDLGNARIDFAWGNMPLQPNYTDGPGDDTARVGMSPYPGDSWADIFLNPDAAVLRATPGIGPWQPTYGVQSNQLQAVDNHVTALRHWKHYPEHSSDGDYGFALTVDWWTEGQPAYMYPNIPGVSKEEAIKQLIECGVNPGILVDAKFDAPTQYEYIGYDGNNYYDLVNAPGEDHPGVIFYKYFEPNDVIGYHWDGRPWLAKESEGMVLTTDSYPGDWVAVEDYEPNYYSGWHSFVVVNTTDPTKDSWQWWN